MFTSLGNHRRMRPHRNLVVEDSIDELPGLSILPSRKYTWYSFRVAGLHCGTYPNLDSHPRDSTYFPNSGLLPRQQAQSTLQSGRVGIRDNTDSFYDEKYGINCEPSRSSYESESVSGNT